MMERIEAEIVLNQFEYEKYFPKSIHLKKFENINQKHALLVDGIPTFSEFSVTWFQENEVLWKHSYKATLRNSLDKHILPRFGNDVVSKIQKADILSFRTGLAKLNRLSGNVGLSPSRINHIMTPLRMILAEAADRFNFETPYKNIRPLKVPKTQVDPFTLDEVMLILENVRSDYQPFYTVRFFTGMRTGEVHGLKWKYVDFERKQILVRKLCRRSNDHHKK